MKFPRLMSMPEGLRTWLETELESLGIDSVVYSRYILSLLQHDVFDPNDYNVEDCWHFNLGDEKVGTQGKRKSKRGVRDYMYCSFEEIKRNAAVQCLMSASEHNTKIESLVDQLCEKLKNLGSEELDCKKADVNDVITDTTSPGDLVEKYYAAFPALSQDPSVVTYCSDCSHSASLNDSCQGEVSEAQNVDLTSQETISFNPPTKTSHVEDETTTEEFLESICQVTEDANEGMNEKRRDKKFGDLMHLPMCMDDIGSPVHDNVEHQKYVEFASKFTQDLADIWNKSQQQFDSIFASKTICRPNIQANPVNFDQLTPSGHIWSVFFDPVNSSLQQYDSTSINETNQLITPKMVTDLEKELYSLLDNCNNNTATKTDSDQSESQHCGHYQQFRQVQPFNCSPANSDDISSNKFYIYHCTNFDDNLYHNKNHQCSSFIKVTPRANASNHELRIEHPKPLKKVEIKKITDPLDQSSRKKKEKLIISPKTHFRPIQQAKEGLLDSYEDGATFNISQSHDYVEFLRTSGGELFIQPEGKSPVFYQTFNVSKNLSCPDSFVRESSPDEDTFVPKFKIRTDLEKCCQTDGIVPVFEKDSYEFHNALKAFGKPWSIYSENCDNNCNLSSDSFRFYKKWSSNISSCPVYETDDEDGQAILQDIEKYCSNTETGNTSYPAPENDPSIDTQDICEVAFIKDDSLNSRYEYSISSNDGKSDDLECNESIYDKGLGEFIDMFGLVDQNPKTRKESICGKENFRRQASKRPCTFHMEGKCRRADCKFLHDFSQITCRFWEEEACFKGDTCPFLHGYPRYTESNDDDEQTTFELYSENDFPALETSSLK